MILIGGLLAIALVGDGHGPAAVAPADLFARTYLRELSLAPDGRHALVFEATGGGGCELVELTFDGDGQGSIARVAHPLPNDGWGRVAWRPDSGGAAFLRGAPPVTELWTIEVGAAPEIALAPSVSAGIFALFWRNVGDGDELLALHNESDPESGRRQAVLSRVDFEQGDFGEGLWPFGLLTIKDAALSPDGRKLALVATATPTYAAEGEPFDLHLIDFGEATECCLTDGDVIVGQPVFSPDSRHLACVLQRARTSLSTAKRDVVLFDVTQESLKSMIASAQVATDDLTVSIGDGVYGAEEELAFVDERTLLLATQHGLADHLLAIELPGAGSTAMPRSRFVSFADASWQRVRAAPATGRIVAIESAPSLPERVVAAEWPRLAPRVVEAPNAELAARPLAKASIVPFRGGDDWPMEGLLLEPAGAAPPFATILLLHGGSSGRQSLRFNDGYAQAWATLGYAVFAPNLRGSSGYSVAFNAANEGDFGGKELEDLDAAADELVRRGVADPARLFLLGHSYGGYLVEMELARTRRFAAACAAAAVSDWESFVRTSDLALLAIVGLGGEPSERAEVYRTRSPLALIERMETPLLLVHGARDRRVPLAQSELLAAALRRRGVESDIVRLPSVGHVIRGGEAAEQWIRVADSWFRTHGAGPALPGPATSAPPGK